MEFIVVCPIYPQTVTSGPGRNVLENWADSISVGNLASLVAAATSMEAVLLQSWYLL